MTTISKGRLWTGRVITGICVLFLLFDATTKIIQQRYTVETSQHIGWPTDTLTPLGIVLLLCTILYIIPRTAVLGAVLLTAWMGGGTAINVRIGYPYIFPIIFGILIWLGLWLRDKGLANYLPLRREPGA